MTQNTFLFYLKVKHFRKFAIVKIKRQFKEGVKDGAICMTEKEVETDKTYDMKTAFDEYSHIVSSIPDNIRREVYMEMAVSNRIYDLMVQKGLSKVEFVHSIGKRPCEITKWLSGQHNFTLSTLAMLSSFFGQPIITVSY